MQAILAAEALAVVAVPVGGLVFAAAVLGAVLFAVASTLTATQADPENTCELHLPWKQLSSWRGATKTGWTFRRRAGKFEKVRECRYEKDNLHGDTEVYDKNGFHLGSVSREGGPITKPPGPGRIIKV